MNENSDVRYWRMRMKYSPTGIDWAPKAWERNEVGIWYGAWSAADFHCALENERNQKPEEYLNKTSDQKQIGWSVTKSSVDTAKRFKNIKNDDWVIVIFSATIHLAKVEGPLTSDPDHPLNQKTHQGIELWKFRKVTDKKSFSLWWLPDFYRLIPQAGRGNVYELWGNNWEAIKFLADCSSEEDVRGIFEKMSDSDRLDFLGPKAWESLCLGYLIIEENFVPTGLIMGATLKDFDMVGRNLTTGERILAQCKKDESPILIEPGFLTAIEGAEHGTKIFYFAYRGCKGVVPPSIKVIDKENIEGWMKSGVGKGYLNSFFSNNTVHDA